MIVTYSNLKGELTFENKLPERRRIFVYRAAVGGVYVFIVGGVIHT